MSVDPLPINGLRRRLRQAPAPELPLAPKEACYSVKHALAPDEATCAAWCEGQLAQGKVDEGEFGLRFYTKKGAAWAGLLVLGRQASWAKREHCGPAKLPCSYHKSE